MPIRRADSGCSIREKRLWVLRFKAKGLARIPIG